jgi:HSP20 family protein
MIVIETRQVRATCLFVGPGPRTEVKQMELKVWTPFLDLDKEWRLFDFPRLIGEGREFPLRPSIDIVRNNGDLVVTAELPGLDPEKDIEISVEGSVLSIMGEKTEEKEVTEDNRYMHERSYGKFSRRISLPGGVSPDKVTADYDKGVLTVRVGLPTEKAEERRTIPVKVKTA